MSECYSPVIHGMHKTRLYRIWGGMKHRCTSSKSKQYKYYAGRGITICDEWMDFIPFMKWALANGYSDELTIDRIDNNKGYSPDNCRWTSMKIQLNNTRHNRNITYNGETHTLSEWAEIKGIKYETLITRMSRMSFEEAIESDYKPRLIELIEYEGEKITKKELANRLGMNYSALRGRFQRGHSVEEVINTEYKKLKNPTPVKYNFRGEQLTLPQIAKMSGVKYSTILYRLSIGKTLEEATQISADSQQKEV